MTVTLVGASWGWNDSGTLSIPVPAGAAAGDFAICVCANQANDNVGAGFVEGPGIGAWGRVDLATYPHPGLGGTTDYRFKTWAGTEPDPITWTCAAILDIGALIILRSDAGVPTLDSHTHAYNAGSTSSPVGPLTGVANRFAVGSWCSNSGGITGSWTPPGGMTTLINEHSAGTLPMPLLVAIGNAPLGSYTKTATLSYSQDTTGILAQWVGTYGVVPTAGGLLPILGVGT